MTSEKHSPNHDEYRKNGRKDSHNALMINVHRNTYIVQNTITVM